MYSDKYCQTSLNMKYYADFVSKKELKYSKFMHGNNLFPRSVNIKNHDRTHKSIRYCLVDKKYYQKFDVEIHSNLIVDGQCISASGEKIYIFKYW